eukprot:665292-Prorocentrum_minimum.AAC.1
MAPPLMSPYNQPCARLKSPYPRLASSNPLAPLTPSGSRVALSAAFRTSPGLAPASTSAQYAPRLTHSLLPRPFPRARSALRRRT